LQSSPRPVKLIQVGNVRMNELAASQGMTPHAFIDKWKSAELRERAAAQAYGNAAR